MSVAAPLMLLGLLAVAVPIYLHLKRREARLIPFPAIPILLKVVKRRSPRIRLHRRVLLAIRLALIVAVVLATARPTIKVKRPGGIRTGNALALVIVLDNSLSMRLVDDVGESLFEKAKKTALTELDRLRPGDAASMITTCNNPLESIQKVDFDLVLAQSAIEHSKVTYARGSLKEALTAAVTALDDSPLSQKEVLLITDLSDGEKRDLPPWSPGTGIAFRVVDAGPKVRRDNRAVSGVTVGPSPDSITREVLVEAAIANHSHTMAKDLEVVLEVEGAEVARGTLDVPARGIAVKRFYHRFKDDGTFQGVVRIPDDPLAADNIRHFTAVIAHSVRVLIINGDFRPGSYFDEAFYLHSALETPVPKEVPISATALDVESAENTTLSGNDVIFLAGVETLSPGLAERLIKFVKDGGGLFISPAEKGSNLAPISELLPAPIRSIRQASKPTRRFAIGAVRQSHPIFKPFGSDPTGLEKTTFTKHLLFEPTPETDLTTLMDTKDGLPLLLERQVGKGRTMLLATTIDRAWSDLPIRPGFLPLVQRAARHLAGRLDDRGPKRILVGKNVHLEVSAGMRRLTVRGPNEKDYVYTAKELDGKSHVTFSKTDLPGDYVVWAEIPEIGGLQELPALGFTVETDPAESDLTRKIEPTNGNAADRLAPVAGYLPIWPYLLMLAVLLILAETLITGVGLRRSHKKASV